MRGEKNITGGNLFRLAGTLCRSVTTEGLYFGSCQSLPNEKLALRRFRDRFLGSLKADL